MVYKILHFAQIPHDGEIKDLDADLIAYASSTSLLWFEFLYAKIFPRETEAVCRIAVDKASLEALAISSRAALDWRSAIETPGASPDKIREALLQTRCRTPLTGGVDVVYTGRADYAVALRDPTSQRLTSYLILVEAKRDSEFNKARSQVLGYAACIWEARRAKGVRLDCTIYGVVTDGLRWQVVMINHHGVVQEGELLDERLEGWAVILRMLVAVINRAAQLQTPNNFPAKSNSEEESTSMDDGDVLHSPKTFYEDETNEENSEAGEKS
ncbi:hypothetical protein L211DRAFT_846713 [Terfezia boudieri ATCC MYA-4762]|uniref:Uncharacterized protein n=1 Tax=Terfezia boudieri ATCC MYA-4762 TaxID=1051890 RepID=A0A3N4LW90_9PEZI|nr:hypothetical protein L211DRAFT_846713 [Terfezia boudieri ATCC MYA-4762]